MTNKEKYVDKADAKAAAETLGIVLWNCYAKKKKGDFKDVLYDWFSQEAEEDKTEITNDYCHFEDVKIKTKDWNELIDKVRELNTRLDKLEEEGKTKDPKDFTTCDIQPSGYSYGSVPEEKSADEMFKELGYERMSDYDYKRIKPDKNGREVCITLDDVEVIKYIKDKEKNVAIAEWISNKELKAIHKKIEELKNGEK